MNKTQIVSNIAEVTGLSISTAEHAFNTAIQGIIETLSQGGVVSLVGFGSFSVKKRAARKARNPRTGKEMLTQAKLVPHFKAGKGLKEQVGVAK
jgi:DNA-binding protein HU-beta